MKKITSKDVAKLAGVSQSTVSLILNNKDNVSFSEETVRKVHAAARNLKYHVPFPLKSNERAHKKLIGVLTPTMVNPYYPLLVQSIEQQAVENGYNVLLCNTHRNHETEKEYLKLLTEELVDGIIYAFSPTFPSLIEGIATATPVVIVGEKNDTLNIDTIGLNSYKAGMIIAEHMLSLGHKKFAYISTPFDNMTLTRKQRLEGIKDKLSEHGLDKNLIVRSATIENEYERPNSIYETEIGYNLALELIDEGADFSAVIGVNDMTAYGIIAALISRGYKIPQQVSVCGFDNIFVSSISTPSLTTIDHCLHHRGKVAMDILLEKMNSAGQKPSLVETSHSSIYRIEYQPQLVVRNSTGPIKNK
ncbi:LacI family DNA-binding transcriptional regulator [Petroclostridium sp. X23]|uniref:LacI family DNA-binding transcriptional regulator n=1 Tax=Petroclostridium sp. X23 TaxID=3045146 RepID=UPI0024AD82E0|nr:LacI family DNA-binding transcriptional regulator [Petroclostridium sp. X23]WHH61497.1 LacI family DNA-binding transcriptional regulator [Petroclostridium sp. X23]